MQELYSLLDLVGAGSAAWMHLGRRHLSCGAGAVLRGLQPPLRPWVLLVEVADVQWLEKDAQVSMLDAAPLGVHLPTDASRSLAVARIAVISIPIVPVDLAQHALGGDVQRMALMSMAMALDMPGRGVLDDPLRLEGQRHMSRRAVRRPAEDQSFEEEDQMRGECAMRAVRKRAIEAEGPHEIVLRHEGAEAHQDGVHALQESSDKDKGAQGIHGEGRLPS